MKTGFAINNNGVSDVFVSIIVTSYGDRERLQTCIHALHTQCFPENQYEVVIVDNHPDGDAPAGLFLPGNFQLIKEKKTGTYAARNKGLSAAKGAIIGFTDSDCIPDPMWIANAVAYLAKNKSCSRVAGSVHVFSSAGQASVSKWYDQIYPFQQKAQVTTDTCVPANLFMRHCLFDIIGLFDDKSLSNGDLEWGRAASSAGFQVHYVESVVIEHAARSLPALDTKEKRKGGGRGMAERKRSIKFANFFRLLHGLRPRIA